MKKAIYIGYNKAFLRGRMKKVNINEFTRHFPIKLTEALLVMGTNDIQEVRIYAEKNAAAVKNGMLVDTGVFIGAGELTKIIQSMCRGSIFAAQTSLVSGFLTIEGGHRVGVCGRCVCENGVVTHMADISAVCIRIAGEIRGAADGIMEYVEYGRKLYNTLIISPPGCGKTTLLRDIARQLGGRHRVCIVDERSEIAACKGGVPSYDVGKYTCVMDSVPKANGIMMLLRTMSPEVIITDETGSAEEEKAIYNMINCGTKIITSAHGYSEKDPGSSEYIGRLTQRNVFERVIVVSSRLGAGTIEKIIADGKVIRHV